MVVAVFAAGSIITLFIHTAGTAQTARAFSLFPGAHPRYNRPMNEEKVYSAALIAIGNEVLSGRTQDTNTHWLAQKLTGRGIRPAEIRVVPDDKDMIIAAVNELRARCDYVITTGGIGPTHDDMTAEAIAGAFDVPYELHDKAHKVLLEFYGEEDLTETRLKMAWMPTSAELIDNPVSAAPGFRIENVFVLAGVPKIMQAMFDRVAELMQGGAPVLSNTVTCGLPESVMAPGLKDLQDRYPAIEIGSYPHYRGGVQGLSLVLRGTNVEVLETATNDLVSLIESHGDTAQPLNMRG